jgi:hypothetical protein
MPSDSNLWPAKTNPSGWGSNIVTNAIDLVKVGTDGVRTVTKENYLVYSETKQSSNTSIWGSIPTAGGAFGVSNPTTAGYSCNDDGWWITGGVGEPPGMGIGTGLYCRVLIEDGPINADTMTFTIPAQHILKHTGAGSNEPKWNFRRASTNASFPLYGTAAEIVTALESLPGVNGVMATGGPCCVSDVTVTVEWDDPTYTFSNVWVSWSQMPNSSSRFPVWNLSTGEPAAVLTFAPASFTSDNASMLRSFGTGVRRVAIAPPDTHPWYIAGATEWTADPFNNMTQTNERRKTGTGVFDPFNVVPRTTGIGDVRNGKVLLQQTRSRVPVGEPSVAAMSTHAVVDEASGAFTGTIDCYMNNPGLSLLTESGELAVQGTQYRYQYQGGIDGIAPPTATLGSADLIVARCYNGRNFATGTTDLFEPFALESPVFSAAHDSGIFGDGPNSSGLSVFNWNFAITGERSSLEMRLAGQYLCGQWQDFPPGFPVPIVPRHQREYWFCFFASGWPKVPDDCEFRFVHKTGSTTHKATAWMGMSTTVAELDDELQLWYGEPIAGYPTVSISGLVQEHEWQEQPVWQYLPLASIDIWNDATGAVFAPRGRVLGLEFRNGTAKQTRPLVSSNRTTGIIKWQRHVGVSDRRYTPADRYTGGQIQYATDAQVTVSTLCKPVLEVDSDFGTCVWEWDGSGWFLVTDSCIPTTEAIPPATDGTTIGERARGTCSVI